MSFIDSLGGEQVEVIKNEGAEDEQRLKVKAVIQPDQGFFPVDTAVFEGDVVECADPRGGTRRLSVGEVKINRIGQAAVDHLAVEWRKTSPVRAAAVRRLGIEGLHPAVTTAANDLFTDGHYASAILEAFKSVDLRVRQLSGIESSGKSLMGQALSGDPPPVNLAVETGRSGEDEQEGFKLIFMGAMQGIRNPKAHEAIEQLDPQRALEYLAFASLLMRRLDDGLQTGQP